MLARLTMTIPRFYCPVELSPGTHVELPPQAAHHAARVLRLRDGEAVILFNGNGAEYPARITHIGKQDVSLEILGKDSPTRESPLNITLAQAISAGEKMDFTLQKAVELGISAIQPLAAARSVVRLKDDRAEKRVQHWQSVVVSACEQSGRNIVPKVAPIADLPAWLAGQGAEFWQQDSGGAVGLILSPLAELTLRDLPRPEGAITLLVGPEGGLTPEEIAMARQCHFTEVQLGPRVLRTETAALAMLSAMQALWGDF